MPTVATEPPCRAALEAPGRNVANGPRRLAAWLLLLVAGLPGKAKAAGGPEDYLTWVKPLLQSRCYACHGSLKQKGGLRLDTVELMLRGGDSGAAVVRGKAEESPILERVSAGDPSERMPPEHEGEPLTPDQVATLRSWIRAGAPAPAAEKAEADPRDHWAFRPIVRPSVPRVRRAGWADNPIDAFVARRHEELGLEANPEASRAELLRRLSIDLIGLPPTPEEIAAFQGDRSPGWYERAADRLLGDPRHGERWARHWMDIWRYSDWWGLGDQLRNSQKHIWHWRDWIVESLNADRSYAEMVRLMLAADELRPDDLGALRATGYLARNYFLFNRNQWMDETVEHVGKGFLGLTLNCAKCHDHKYDPIAQVDYYRMRAIFEPYHVRVDVVPGEPDLGRDGIPRAYDGLLDAPTYRFLRGEENRPDKSAPVGPAIPAMLAFAPLKPVPIDLPATAWQPERRGWVADAHRGAALAKIAGAERGLAAARAKLAAAGQGPARVEIEREMRAADSLLAAARAERDGVDRRAEAMRADSAEARRRAALAEREQAAARARADLAEAELRLHPAAAGEKDAALKAVASAKEALGKAEKAARDPGEAYTRLVGAQWVPTRFSDSNKDDPTVAFPARSTGRRTALAGWITDRRNPLTARVAANHIWARHFGTPLVATVFDFGRKGSPPSHPELLDWLAAELVESGWSMKHLHRLIVGSATYRLSSSASSASAEDAAVAKDPDNAQLWRRTPTRLESQVVRDSILALAGTLDPAMGGPPVPTADQAASTRRSLYFFHSNNERNPFLTTFDEALVKECYRREQSIVPQQALALTNSRLVLDASRPIASRLGARLAAIGGPTDDRAFVRLAFVTLLGAEPTEAEEAAMVRSLGEWARLPDAGQGGDAGAGARADLVWVLLNHNDFVTLR
ncbi:Planctomycete cytochrome C [Aquisphaera giovannonii]|uniref:Planctomycete cytochrome C n=1 Tax=Aquisphaera giovannonii TaxID=406548 RepID=A0A5B9W1Y6_9BACT|nr:PSD1 and planctomycete cytochrome C domain-containing protein [Aquisphaera giovannonii]QEH34563.1 Planctomycete cytochrome C [Aquisphaera giovannonii]